MSLPTKEFRTSYHDHVLHNVVPHIPNSGGQLLELGGGIGATAAEARRLGIVDQAIVTDMIDNSIEYTQLDFTFKGNFKYPAFLNNIVAQRGKFKMILALDILEHLLDTWTMVKRLTDSLDDGILDRTHLHFFMRSTAIELMEQTRLKISKITSTYFKGKIVRLFRAITFGLSNTLADRRFIIVAQKI